MKKYIAGDHLQFSDVHLHKFFELSTVSREERRIVCTEMRSRVTKLVLFSCDGYFCKKIFASKPCFFNQDSVAGSVIQASGMVVFEDVLRTVAW